MDILSLIILLIVAVCFFAAVRYIIKHRGKGCSGNCSCCEKMCSSARKENEK